MTERDYTVRTERGGLLTAIRCAIMAMLMLAEWTTGGRFTGIAWNKLSWIPGMCARLLFIFAGKENDSLGEGYDIVARL